MALPDEEQGAFSSSLLRGTDMAQASLYAFTKAVGNLTGFDALSEWGEEGILRNMEEMEENPAQLHSWDDIDSLSDAWTYVVEAIGEQIPNLGIDIAAFAATRGAVGMAARKHLLTKEQKAQAAKTFFRKAGPEAQGELLDKIKKAKAAGGNIALFGAAAAQNIGETQMEFDAEGIGDETGDIMLTGAIKGALDAIPIQHVLKLARSSGVPPSSLPAALTAAAKQVGITGAKESVTEGAQTFVDKVALDANLDDNYDLFSEENLMEISNAMLKGGIAGGALGGTVDGVRQLQAYRQHKDNADAEIHTAEMDAHDELDEMVQTKVLDMQQEELIVPEDTTTVLAQLDALANPTSEKDTAFFSPETELPLPDKLPEGFIRIDRDNGTYITTNLEKAHFIDRLADRELPGQQGNILYNRPEGKTESDGTMIVVEDKNGNRVSEFATGPSTYDRDLRTAEGHMPEGGTVRISNSDEVVGSRTQRLLQSIPTVQREQILAKLESGQNTEELREVLREMGAARVPHLLEQDAAAEQIAQVVDDDTQKSFDQEGEVNLPSDYDAERPGQYNQPTGYTQEEAEYVLSEIPETDEKNVMYDIADAKHLKGKKEIIRIDIPPEFAAEPDTHTVNTPGHIDHRDLDAMPKVIRQKYQSREAAEYMLERAKEINGYLPVGFRYEIQNQKGEHIIVPRAEAKRSVTKLAADGIRKARAQGVLRKKIYNQKKGDKYKKQYSEEQKERARNSVIQATDRNGEQRTMSIADLISAGRDILSAEKIGDRSSDKFQLDALTHMLGRLMDLEWDVSDAFIERNGQQVLRPELIVGAENILKTENPKRIQDLDLKATESKEQTIDFEQEAESREKDLDKDRDAPVRAETDSGLPIRQRDFGEGDKRNPTKITVKGKKSGLRPNQTRLPSGRVVRDENTAPIVTNRLDKETHGEEKIIDGKYEKVYHPLFPEETSEEDSILQSTDQGLEYEADKEFGPQGENIEQELRSKDRTKAPIKLKEKILSRTKGKVVIFDVGQDTRDQTDEVYHDISDVEADLINGILRTVGIKQAKPIIVTGAGLQNAVEAGVLTQEEAGQIKKDFKDNAKLKGRFIPKGEEGIIVVRSLPKDASRVARHKRIMYIGHEMGHGVLNTIYESILKNTGVEKGTHEYKRNKNWAAKLRKAFAAENETHGRYQNNEAGFKEWFSDKVVARALEMNQEASNPAKAKPGTPRKMHERIFDKAATALNQIWKLMQEALPDRFLPNAKFNSIVSAMTQADVFSSNDFGYGQWESMISENPASAQETLGGSVLRQLYTKSKKFHDPAAWPFARVIFAAEAQLRALDPIIARLIYQPTHTQKVDEKSGEAYITLAHEKRDAWNGQLAGVLKKHQDGRKNSNPHWRKELKVAFEQLARELPDDKLSPLATDLRAFIKEFHAYLKEAIPHIGEIKNFFPHDYNLDKIHSSRAEFMDILAKYNIPDPDAVADNILGKPQVHPLLEVSPDQAVGLPGTAAPVTALHKSREIKDQALIEELVDKGFLNINPVTGLVSYIYGGTQRAESERKFGGYGYPAGYVRNIKKRKSMTSEEQRIAKATNTKILNELMDNAGIPGNSRSRAQFMTRLKLAVTSGYAQQDENGDILWRDPNLKLKQQFNAARERFYTQRAKELGVDLSKEEFSFAEKQLNKQALREADEHAQEIQRLTAHSLGLVSVDTNSTLGKILEQVKAFEGLRVLLFSGIASIPEFATIVINNRGVLTPAEMGKVFVDSVANYKEAKEIAQLHGVLRNELAAAIAGDLFQDVSQSRGPFTKALPYMFRYNGNEGIMHFTRLLSAATARAHLAKAASEHADGKNVTRNLRILQDYGLTPKQVNTWDKAGRPIWHMLPEGTDPKIVEASRAVSDGVSRYAHISGINPTSADRPPMGNNVFGSMIIHLKGFAYTYGRTTIMGMKREIEARVKAGDMSQKKADEFMAAAAWLVPAMGFLMFLSAISDELRNRLKSGWDRGTWASNQRDTEKMMKKWIERSGLTSIPFGDAVIDPSVNNLTFAAGPTASHIYELVAKDYGDLDKNVTKKALKSIPVVSQVPMARKMVYNALEDEQSSNN